MIKLQDLTPEVYYKQSRDFQFIGRLYDLVLNSVKTNADMIYDIPSSDMAGSNMIDLLALTLGFRARHNYNIKQLSAICSIFPIILKNKGNIYSIELVCDAILHAEGITDKSEVLISQDDKYLIQIFISQQLSDITLLSDLLDYILPAGMICEIIKANTYTAVPALTITKPNNTIIKTTAINDPTQTNNNTSILNVTVSGLNRADTNNDYVNGLDGSGNRIPGFSINSVIYGANNDPNNNGGN